MEHWTCNYNSTHCVCNLCERITNVYMNTGCDGKIHGEILLDVVSMCCFYYSFEFCLGVVCRLGFTESVCVSPWQERRADTQQHQKHTTEKQIRKIFTVVSIRWWWIGGELFFFFCTVRPTNRTIPYHVSERIFPSNPSENMLSKSQTQIYVIYVWLFNFL